MNRIFALFLCIGWLLIGCGPEQVASNDALQLVPTNAPLLIRVNKPQSLVDFWKNNPMAASLKAIQPLQKWSNTMQLKPGHEAVMQELQSGFWLVYAQTGARDFGLLLLAEDPDSSLLGLLAAPSKNLLKTYNGIPLYNGQLFQRPTVYCRINQYTLIATHAALLEEAAKMNGNEVNLTQSESFQKARKMADPSADLTLFVQGRESDNALGKWLPGWKNQASMPGMGWMTLDLRTGEDVIQMAGVALPTDSATLQFASCFEPGSGFGPEAWDILPRETGAALLFTTQQPKAFLANHRDYLAQHNKLRPAEFWERRHGLNLGQWASTWLGNEWGIFYPESPTGLGTPIAYTLLAEETNAAAWAETMGDSLRESTDEINIYRSSKPGALQALFGDAFETMARPYWCMVQGWVFWSEDPEALKNQARWLASNNILGQSDAFASVRNQSSSSPHMTMFFTNPAFATSFHQQLQPPVALSTADQKTVQKLRFGLLQTESSGKAGLLTGQWHYLDEIQSTARQVWSTALDANLAMAPQLVVNHNNQHKEVMVTDVNHVLYLIGADGRIMWKKQLPGPVMGKVHQVDLYKNKRLQYALVAGNQLVVLDRNGGAVEPFPITMKFKVSAPLTVLDYDNNRNYRFFVGTEGGLFLFDSQGKSVGGWSFPSKSAVVDELDFIAAGGKDYLLIHTQDGKVYITDRRGKNRLKNPVKTAVPKGFRWKTDKGKTVAYAFDHKGYQHYIFLNGQKDSVEVATTSRRFEVQEYNNQVILSDGNSVKVISTQRPMEAQWPEDECSGLKYLIFKNKLYLGAVQVSNKQVFLIDDQGEPVPGFPVFGSVGFAAGDLNGTGMLTLITGDGKNLLAYTLN